MARGATTTTSEGRGGWKSGRRAGGHGEQQDDCGVGAGVRDVWSWLCVGGRRKARGNSRGGDGADYNSLVDRQCPVRRNGSVGQWAAVDCRYGRHRSMWRRFCLRKRNQVCR